MQKIIYPQNEDKETSSLNTIQELFSHLEKRQGILSGLVISGGEPLLNPYTPLIIKKAKSLDYKIKLDTNGTLPNELEYFVQNPELCPDFIAMDLKTSPQKYASILCNPKSKFYNNEEYFFNNLKKSIQIISNLPQENREWRERLLCLLQGVAHNEERNKDQEARLKRLEDEVDALSAWRFKTIGIISGVSSTIGALTAYISKLI